MSRVHLFETRMLLPLPRLEVFAFFSDARNLGRITPPELRFQILTPAPVDMRQGALIDYRLHLFGVPMRWRTLISRWDPPNEFVDEQLAGPYRAWIHTHRFRVLDGGTSVEDEVRYALPFPPLGEIGHFLVRRQVQRIFAFRHRAIRRLLVPDRGGDRGARPQGAADG